MRIVHATPLAAVVLDGLDLFAGQNIGAWMGVMLLPCAGCAAEAFIREADASSIQAAKVRRMRSLVRRSAMGPASGQRWLAEAERLGSADGAAP